MNKVKCFRILLLSFVIYFFLFWYISQSKNYRSDCYPLLYSLFDKVEEKTIPKSSLQEFKMLPLDSAVVYYNYYPEIFSDAFSEVLRDTFQVVIFESFCNAIGINVNSREGIYVIIALFHQKLNEEEVDLDDLKKRMQRLVKIRRKIY